IARLSSGHTLVPIARRSPASPRSQASEAEIAPLTGHRRRDMLECGLLGDAVAAARAGSRAPAVWRVFQEAASRPFSLPLSSCADCTPMEFKPGHTVGIDLGTTFSTLAILDEKGDPVAVANDDGELETPSLILLAESGRVIVG